jgi:hypothetical protein
MRLLLKFLMDICKLLRLLLEVTTVMLNFPHFCISIVIIYASNLKRISLDRHPWTSMCSPLFNLLLVYIFTFFLFLFTHCLSC